MTTDTWVVLGDSIITRPKGGTPSAAVQTTIPTLGGPSIINLGVPGMKLSRSSTMWHEETNALDFIPTIRLLYSGLFNIHGVLVALGTNDHVHRTAEEFKQGLDELVTFLQGTNLQAAFLLPPPKYGEGFTGEAIQVSVDGLTLEDYRDMIRGRMPSEYSCIGGLDLLTVLHQNDYADGVHLNEGGSLKLAQYITNTLQTQGVWV